MNKKKKKKNDYEAVQRIQSSESDMMIQKDELRAI